jgi:hypothetical protein
MYIPLLDELSAELKQMQWEEASGVRKSMCMPTNPNNGNLSPTPLYGMPNYQSQPKPNMFHAPAPGHWASPVYPSGYPPAFNGVAAAAPALADQEPYPYFMQACHPLDSCSDCYSCCSVNVGAPPSRTSNHVQTCPALSMTS